MFKSLNGADGFEIEYSFSGHIIDPNRKPFLAPNLSYLKLHTPKFLKDNGECLVVQVQRVKSHKDGDETLYCVARVLGDENARPFIVYDDDGPEIIGSNISYYIDALDRDQFLRVLDNYPVFLFDVIAIKLDEFDYNFDKLNKYLLWVKNINTTPELL